MTRPDDATRVRPLPDLTASGAAAADAIDDLVAFHARIRETLAVLAHIAAANVVVGAADVIAFLDGPLVWHDEDEEVGLLAHLHRLKLTPFEQSVVDGTRRGHEHMESLIEAVTPVLGKLVASVPVSHAAWSAFVDDARRLGQLLEGHMHLEEVELFPLARKLLDATELEGMASDAKRRHQETRPRRAVRL